MIRSNDTYAWTNHYVLNRNYTSNGLNRYTAITGSTTPTYDGRGNLMSAGTTTYSYNSGNMLTSASGGATLSYDPMQRLYETVGGGVTTRMAYDGQSLIAEYNGSNILLRRYVHGPGTDEPLVWYEGTGTSDRRWLHADERGSIVAVSNSSGAVTNVNAYDEYGIPRPTNVGRFQYTGQQWIAELGLYHYRARIYSPTLGRFLQTDPIGYGDGMNMHAYVGNDPVNFTDPSGLTQVDDIKVVGPWPKPQNPYSAPTTIMVNMIDLRNIIDRAYNVTNPVEPGNDDRPACDTPDPVTGEYPAGCTVVVPATSIVSVSSPQLTPVFLSAEARPRRRDYCTVVSDQIGISKVSVGRVCAAHDICYGSNANRSVCDRRFYDALLRACATVRWDFMCRVDARSYYWGVRNFGEDFYEGSGRND